MTVVPQELVVAFAGKNYAVLHSSRWRRSSLPVPRGGEFSASINLNSTPKQDRSVRRRTLSLDDVPPNVLRRKREMFWQRGFSLGLDIGTVRTGVALSRGYTFRPYSVLELRKDKLEHRLMEIADNEEVDEFIVGLPKSSNGEETHQSQIVRRIVYRLAVRAAERGWRVYLLDEYGSTTEAYEHIIEEGRRDVRTKRWDAYAAAMILKRYFSRLGEGVELVVPMKWELQDKIRNGSLRGSGFFSPNND